MTYAELKNKINNFVETIKGQTNISGYKLNVILNDLLNFINNNSPSEKLYNELVVRCTDSRNLFGSFDVVVISADSTMENDIIITADGGENGKYLISGFGDFEDLTGASLQIGSFNGFANILMPGVPGSPINVRTTTPTLTFDISTSVYSLSNEQANDLLKNTTIVLRVPIPQ